MELIVSKDWEVTAVPVPKFKEELMESVKVGNREMSMVEGLLSVQGELTVSADREVTAVAVLRVIEWNLSR